VVAREINHRGLQARHAELAEVVGVTGQPGALASVEELADLAIGDQVGSGAVTLVEEGEGAVAFYVLVAGTQLVAAVAVGEQGAPGAVVDFAFGHPISVVAIAGIALGATGSAAVV